MSDTYLFDFESSLHIGETFVGVVFDVDYTAHHHGLNESTRIAAFYIDFGSVSGNIVKMVS